MIGGVIQINAQDIGTVGLLGSTVLTGPGSYRVSGAGADIWGRADALQFSYQTATGDFTYVTEVLAQTGANRWAKAGLMVRNDLTPGSVNALVAVTPSNGVTFQWRSFAGDTSEFTNLKKLKVPIWLKLVRTGSTISGFASKDGTNWTAVGTEDLPALDATVEVGLAVTSHDPATLSTADFTHLELTPAQAATTVSPPQDVVFTASDTEIDFNWNSINTPAGIARYDVYRGGVKIGSTLTNSYADLELPAATTYTYSCQAIDGNGQGSVFTPSYSITTLPGYLTPPWTHQDIGNVLIGGTSSLNSGQGAFSMVGSGADIWHQADAFQYVFQHVSGDGEFVARLNSLSNTDANAKAGLMVRTSTEANSPYILLAATKGGQGIVLEYRAKAGAASVSAAKTGVVLANGAWLRLVRDLNIFYAFYSTDGQEWTQLGAKLPLVLGNQLTAGLAVTSHNAHEAATAEFDNVVLAHELPVDTQPPSAPTNLRDTGSNDTEIGIAFDPSQDQTLVTGYNIYRDGMLIDRTAATSGINFDLEPNTTYSFAVSAVNLAGEESPLSKAISISTLPPLGLPSPLQQADIGSVNLVGGCGGIFGFGMDSMGGYHEEFNSSGSGNDIWGTADAFHYVYQPIQGETEVSACVSSLYVGPSIAQPISLAQPSEVKLNAWAKAGLMVRDSLDPDAKEVSIFTTPGNGVTFQWRSKTGGQTSYHAIRGITGLVWLKLIRQGDLFIGSYSIDNLNWIEVDRQTVVMTGVAPIAGMAVTSHNNANLAGANFSAYDVSSNLVYPPYTLTIAKGNNQTFAAGSTPAVPPSVLITDASGNPAVNIYVHVLVSAGGGSMQPLSEDTSTDSEGIVTIPVFNSPLNLSATYQSQVSIRGASNTVTFTETVTSVDYGVPVMIGPPHPISFPIIEPPWGGGGGGGGGGGTITISVNPPILTGITEGSAGGNISTSPSSIILGPIETLPGLSVGGAISIVGINLQSPLGLGFTFLSNWQNGVSSGTMFWQNSSNSILSGGLLFSSPSLSLSATKDLPSFQLVVPR